MRPIAAALFVLTTYIVLALGGARLLARAGFSTRRGADNRPRRPVLLLAAAINLLILAVVVGEHLLLGGTLADLGLRVEGREVLLAACAAAATGCGAVLVSRGRAIGTPHLAGAGATVVATLACAALMEEVLFRGILLADLRGLGMTCAVIISSLVFAAVHALTNEVSWTSIAGWLIGGVSLAGCFLLSGSLGVAVAAHLARNLGNVFVVQPALEGENPHPHRKQLRLAYYLSTALAATAVAALPLT